MHTTEHTLRFKKGSMIESNLNYVVHHDEPVSTLKMVEFRAKDTLDSSISNPVFDRRSKSLDERDSNLRNGIWF